MNKDLGTYHVAVEFHNARGYIQEWTTSMRFPKSNDGFCPISQLENPILPPWEDEEDLINTIIFQYTENNYDCDCNRKLFIARAYGEDELDEDCGLSIQLKKLTLIRPDNSREVIWEDEEVQG